MCAEESIPRWYGQGGNWINLGLPMHVEMDRKTENGVEIQNSECGRSGIMMRISIVKYAKNEEEQKYDRENLPHGITSYFSTFVP